MINKSGKKRKEKQVGVSVLLSEEKRHQLRMAAARRDVTVSELLREAIDQIIKIDDK